MKQLTCEMCGSTDMTKQDGVYVCQNCGMKYSVEEAKKMMIEGTVDVQGTVKVDNSAFVEKYLANARRAKQKEDWEETEKYYNMVEQNDPSNIEAIFYSSYGKAKRSLIESDIYKRQAAFKVLQNCVSIIDDNFNIDKEAEQKVIIEQIKSDIFAMACSSYVYNQRTNQYGTVVWTDKSQTESLFISLIDEFITTLDNIVNKYPTDIKVQSVDLLKAMIECHEFQNNNMGLTNNAKNIRKGVIFRIHERIHEIDPSHPLPIRASSATPGSNKPLYTASGNDGSGKSIFKALLLIGIGVLLFGAFMFICLDEVDYFVEYLLISGYYGGINFLFVLDYICILIGAIGTIKNYKTADGKVSVALILGVLGFVFAWLFAIIGHVLSIIGIVLAVKESKETDDKTAVAVCTMAEICAFVSSLIGILAI